MVDNYDLNMSDMFHDAGETTNNNSQITSTTQHNPQNYPSFR